MSSQSKWKLLGTAIIAVAILGGVVGWQQFYLKPTSPMTSTATQAATTLPRTQSTTQQLGTLLGKVFHDYNGNGKQDPREPDTPNVVVALNGRNVTATNSTGWYVIDNVPYGMNTIRPFPPKNFRYMCESASEFRSVEEPYRVLVLEDARKDIGLMEGWLTQPIFSKTRFISSRLLYDWDPDPNHSLWWNGKKGTDRNDHGGHDYDMDDNNPILAAAPGKVAYVGEDSSGKGILIEHVVYSQNGYHHFYTDYWHISESLVGVGQTVQRGQTIARSGHTGQNQHPHLHFGLYMDDFPFKILDPYKPVFDVKPNYNGYWTLDKDHPDTAAHIWVPWVSNDINPNSLGYWTKNNDPQFFA